MSAPIYLAGPGWYEFLKNGNEYHTIRIWEDGSSYTPNPDKITKEDFMDAVKRGDAWKLIRTPATVFVMPKLRVVR